jgi:hypothetical protein
MFYIFRVNAALAELGLGPKIFNPNFRVIMQRVGKAAGNTPQEVALHMAAELPLTYRVQTDISVIRRWLAANLVDRTKDEVREALSTFALWQELT